MKSMIYFRILSDSNLICTGYIDLIYDKVKALMALSVISIVMVIKSLFGFINQLF